LALSGVSVEKVRFSQNSQNLGDRKCLRKRRKSFVELPDAKFFSEHFAETSFSTATGESA
jgi:hypothetical protein